MTVLRLRIFRVKVEWVKGGDSRVVAAIGASEVSVAVVRRWSWVTRCAVRRVRGVWLLGFGGIFWVRLR